MQNAPTQTLAPLSAGRRTSPLVLVVEDNERNARMLVAMLTAAGYDSRWADDGHEGLRLAAECQPELVIADLQMPGLDGLSMTRQLKARSDTVDIPVVALTAHAMAEHAEAALAAGCVKFLTKPIRFQTLLVEVADAIQRKTA
ncbi:MAG: response regulator [Pirellulales bacterium]